MAAKLAGPLKEFFKGHFACKVRAKFRKDVTIESIEAQGGEEAQKFLDVPASPENLS